MTRVELPKPLTYRLSEKDLGSEWVVEDKTGTVVERFRIEGWENGLVTIRYKNGPKGRYKGGSKETKWRSTVQRRITDGVWLPPDDTAGRFL